MQFILNLATKLLLPVLFLAVMVLIAGNLTAEEQDFVDQTATAAPSPTSQIAAPAARFSKN